MSLCRGCGAAIEWVKTPAGKYMPVDKEPVLVVEGEGKNSFVTDEGEIIRGRRATAEEESQDLPVAFVPHWATCPKSRDFHR